jgi:UDP-N-acetylglucosamine--N-acetylmuramyl-(pentapeptide) pyrophosphoryl-undecaprenol N-acetylglucosamine transferase
MGVKMKVLIISCGIGMGHASRSMALARKLEEEGVEVLFASYGSGYQMLEDHSQYHVVKLPDIKFYGSDGELDLKHTARKSIDVPFIFLKSIYHESRIIKNFRPDVVVADSHYSAPITCRIIGIPCVLVSNDLKIDFSEVYYRDRTMEYLENGLQRFVRDVSRLCSSIIIPDIKDSCEVPSQIYDRVNFTGPLLNMDPETMLSKEEIRKNFGFSNSESIVLATVGGTWFGRKLLNMLNQAAVEMNCDRLIIVTGPQINLDSKFYSQRVLNQSFVGGMMEWMKLSDLVISLAGHTTSMEIASLGIPNLMVPIDNHPEQLKNASNMRKHGISFLEDMRILNPKKLANDINCLLASDELNASALKTREIFSQYKGTENAVQLIMNCVESYGITY